MKLKKKYNIYKIVTIKFKFKIVGIKKPLYRTIRFKINKNKILIIFMI